MTLPDLALSVRQPWAWAIIYAGKRLENRTANSIRLGGMKPGRICIHASKGMTRDEYEGIIRHPGLPPGITPPRPEEMVRGAIIGVVTVEGIANHSTDPWWCGPRALMLKDAVAVDPIPVGGELGYFEWRKNIGQPWSAKAIEEAKPWMFAWPDDLKPKRAPPPELPLERAPLLERANAPPSGDDK